MNDKRLLEIPVYYISKEMHNKKWQIKRDKFEQEAMEKYQTKSEASASFKNTHKMRMMWDFVRIIGYIRIIYKKSTGEIVFDIYKSTLEKYRYDFIFKISFYKERGPNLRIPVRKLNNEQIIFELNKKINYITEKFFKNNYLDLEVFNNLIKYYDFIKFIND
jgi:hypothetical protein